MVSERTNVQEVTVRTGSGKRDWIVREEDAQGENSNERNQHREGTEKEDFNTGRGQ